MPWQTSFSQDVIRHRHKNLDPASMPVTATQINLYVEQLKIRQSQKNIISLNINSEIEQNLVFYKNVITV